MMRRQGVCIGRRLYTVLLAQHSKVVVLLFHDPLRDERDPSCPAFPELGYANAMAEELDQLDALPLMSDESDAFYSAASELECE